MEDLARLVEELALPSDARKRVGECLRPLGRFPDMGPRLTGRWDGARFLLGPWRWMLLVYEHDEERDRVVVTTIQDARRADAATADRGG